MAAINALVLGVSGIAGVVGWYARPDAPTPVSRFVVPLAPNENYTNQGRHLLALSPDGSVLVYVANNRLHLRHLDQLAATEIQGTNDGSGRNPFFSPNGQWLAFWAGGQLKRVGLSGGAPVTLARIGNPLGASWSADDTILFANNEGVWRLPGGGGTPERVVTINAGEIAHGPQLLPDGDHVLFTLRSEAAASWDDAAIVAQSLATGQRTTILKRGHDARYVPTGHLVYASAGTLLAVRFDAGTLTTTGGAVALVDKLATGRGGFGGAAQFALAANGTLAYVQGETSDLRGTLVWVDRTGREAPTPASGEIPGLANPRLSPDGRSVALISDGNLWVQDLQGRPPIKLTFDGNHFSPVWTRDGRRLVYETNDGLAAIAADASGQAEKASGSGHYHAFAVTPDGDVIVVRLPDSTGSQTPDILRLSPGTDPTPKPVVVTQNAEGGQGFSLSPDGRWLAYTTSATGAVEIWVQPFPGPGAAVRVSPKGGEEPVWAKNGRELFYREGRRMMAVSVSPGTPFSFSPPSLLFEIGYEASSQPPTYDVAADGRFLMVKGGEKAIVPPIAVTLNWFEELKRRVP